MATAAARRRGGGVKKRRFSRNVHARSADNSYKHTEATPGPNESHKVDEREPCQDSTGSHAGGSGDCSGNNPSMASQQGKYSDGVSDQENEYLAAPEYLQSSEVSAHAIVRGFRMKVVKSLVKFLQRRASTTGSVVEIKESWLDGNALIVAAKAVHLPRIMRLNGVLYAGMRLVIRPYHAKNSIGESHVRSDEGTGASRTDTSGPLSDAASPRFSSDESADRYHSADITEYTKPDDMNVKFLPGLDFLAAATASNKSLQEDLKPEAKEEMPNILTPKPTMTREDEMVIQFSETNAISLEVSYRCLSQSDFNLELAHEAVAFASEFARLNDLVLQSSIICLEENLWNMDNATLFIQTVVQEVSDKTGMTIDWALECLAANGWTANEAVESFEELKQLLPHEAFKKE